MPSTHEHELRTRFAQLAHEAQLVVLVLRNTQLNVIAAIQQASGDLSQIACRQNLFFGMCPRSVDWPRLIFDASN